VEPVLNSESGEEVLGVARLAAVAEIDGRWWEAAAAEIDGARTVTPVLFAR